MNIKDLINLIRNEIKSRAKKNGIVSAILIVVVSILTTILENHLVLSDDLKGKILGFVIEYTGLLVSLICGAKFALIISAAQDLKATEKNRNVLEDILGLEAVEEIESVIRENSADYPKQKTLTDKAVDKIDKMSLIELQVLTMLLNEESLLEQKMAEYLSTHPEETAEDCVYKILLRIKPSYQK